MDAISEVQKIKWSYISTAALMYAGFCAGLWHIGFWSTFDINIFQYMKLQDVIKDFIYPFVSICGIGLISIFINSNPIKHIQNIDSPESEKIGKGRYTPTGIFLNKHVNWLLIVLAVFITVVLIWGNIMKYTVVPMMLFPVLSVYVFNKGVFEKYVINPDIRFWLCTMFVVLPLTSFFFSKYKSKEISENLSFRKIISINKNDGKSLNELIGLKYIGSTTEKIFLTDSLNERITILNTSSIDYITMKAN